jgi:hypothetical protein
VGNSETIRKRKTAPALAACVDRRFQSLALSGSIRRQCFLARQRPGYDVVPIPRLTTVRVPITDRYAVRDSGIIAQLTRVSRNGVQHVQKFRSLLACRVVTCVFLSLISLLFTLSVSAQSVPPELINGLKWRLIGPFRGGRAVAVAGVPGDSTTFYFGAVNGGIWTTTDAGVVWKPIFDGQPVASTLAVAPSDPKTIYSGTGESDIREDLSSGNDVYKSSDAGTTWHHMGLEDTRQISRIVVDPQNANIIYVGALGHAFGGNAQRGVYKSVDGGEHWTQVLDLGPDIGISDLAMCSSDPQLCLPAHGMCGVLPGAPMLRLMDPTVAFTAHKMPARPGLVSTEAGCHKAIGGASVLMLRRTASASMRSSFSSRGPRLWPKLEDLAFIALTMEATVGSSPTPPLLLPGGRGISIESRSIHTTPT